MSLDPIKSRTDNRVGNFKNIAPKFNPLDPKHFDNIDNVNKLKILANT